MNLKPWEIEPMKRVCLSKCQAPELFIPTTCFAAPPLPTQIDKRQVR